MSLVKIFDNAFAGIKPPEEITVNAILKESKSLTPVALYKKIISIVEKK